jgi:hypothetical protein
MPGSSVPFADLRIDAQFQETNLLYSVRGLPKTELIFGTCDPYVTVHLGPMKLFRTETKHTRNPDFDYKWQDFVCGKADKLVFKIKDLDVDGSQVQSFFLPPMSVLYTLLYMS